MDNGKTNAYRWMAIDPPLTLAVDATGRPHLGMPPNPPLSVSVDGTLVGSANAIGLHAGPGLILAASNGPEGIHIDEFIDSSVVTHRVAPPAGPGECLDPVSHAPLGTGEWAADATALYFCVPSTTFPSGFQWARVPLSLAW